MRSGIRALVEAGLGEYPCRAPVIWMRGREIAPHQRPRRRLRCFAIARAPHLQRCDAGELEERCQRNRSGGGIALGLRDGGVIEIPEGHPIGRGVGEPPVGAVHSRRHPGLLSPVG